MADALRTSAGIGNDNADRVTAIEEILDRPVATLSGHTDHQSTCPRAVAGTLANQIGEVLEASLPVRPCAARQPADYE